MNHDKKFAAKHADLRNEKENAPLSHTIFDNQAEGDCD